MSNTNVYFSEIIDTYDQSIIAWKIRRTNDNQPIESFWGTLKSEYYYRNKFDTFESLIVGVEYA